MKSLNEFIYEKLQLKNIKKDVDIHKIFEVVLYMNTRRSDKKFIKEIEIFAEHINKFEDLLIVTGCNSKDCTYTIDDKYNLKKIGENEYDLYLNAFYDDSLRNERYSPEFNVDYNPIDEDITIYKNYGAFSYDSGEGNMILINKKLY